MASLPPPPTTLSFRTILSDSKKILKSHTRHFLALSVLFLLPISFSLSVFPTLQLLLSPSSPNQSLLRHHNSSSLLSSLQPFLLSLFYSFSLLILSLSASATISYSVYHGLFSRPVKLLSALQSLSFSFLRLLLTFLSSLLIIFSISLAYAFLLFALIRAFELVPFHFVYSPHFIPIVYLTTALLFALLLVYLATNWALSPVVVVVEGSWGLEPLRRSAYLVKGMRGIVMCLLFVFGCGSGLFLWGNWATPVGPGVWRALWFVLLTVLSSAFVMLFLLNFVTANTVLYMYCKALRGELAEEIAEEFAREYLRLPYDEEKAPYVVSVVRS